jgi:glycosyltransferase involved in cell wall biosynthesis
MTPPRSTIVLPADPQEMRIGGIASFVRSFVKLAPADFEIRMIGVSPSLAPRAWSEVELEGRRIGFYPATRASTTARSRVPLALRFSAALVRNGPPPEVTGSVIQFHRPGTDLPFARMPARRLRVVHLSTADLTHASSESRWRRLGGWLGRMEHASFRRMDRVLVVNREVADAYRRRWPDLADRIAFVPNFYDDTIFRAADDPAAAEAAGRATLAVGTDARVVLFAGRLESQKEPLLMLEAFARAAATDPSLVLALAGDGSLRGAVQVAVKRLGLGSRVRLLGTTPRARMPELLSVASALLISSAFETGPTVGYEALAMGVPVVTTPVGTVAELVAQHAAGAVAAAHDAASLADALLAVLRGDPAELRTAALTAAAPFAASAVLAPVYEEHRSYTPAR